MDDDLEARVEAAEQEAAYALDARKAAQHAARVAKGERDKVAKQARALRDRTAAARASIEALKDEALSASSAPGVPPSRQLLMNIVAHMHRRGVRVADVYRGLDAPDDRGLAPAVLAKAFTELEVPCEEASLSTLIAEMDADDNGLVSWPELQAALAEATAEHKRKINTTEAMEKEQARLESRLGSEAEQKAEIQALMNAAVTEREQLLTDVQAAHKSRRLAEQQRAAREGEATGAAQQLLAAKARDAALAQRIVEAEAANANLRQRLKLDDTAAAKAKAEAVSAAAEAQLRSKSEDRVRRAREAERAATIEAWSLAERVASAQAEVAVQIEHNQAHDEEVKEQTARNSEFDAQVAKLRTAAADLKPANKALAKATGQLAALKERSAAATEAHAAVVERSASEAKERSSELKALRATLDALVEARRAVQSEADAYRAVGKRIAIAQRGGGNARQPARRQASVRVMGTGGGARAATEWVYE